MSSVSSLAYRRLQAPADNLSVLIDPPGTAAEAQRVANVAALNQASLAIGERSLADLRQQTKRELLAAAVSYTQTYRAGPAVPPDAEQLPLWMAGHQPQLFHPGVWLKNFVLSRCAERSGGIAVNLVIDNDLLRGTAIRVPTGSPAEPRQELVEYDAPTTALPFEERRLENPALAQSFADRVKSTIGSLVAEPLIADFWPTVLERLAATPNWGEALSQARHRWEEKWGAATLELPMSHVCALPTWWAFVASILQRLDSFVAIHNSALAEYRRVHRLRGKLHPIPDLAQASDWLETPFWVWQLSNPQRRHLFMQRHGCDVTLSDRAGWETRCCVRELAAGLAALSSQGIKLRPRALTTTLFTRLCAADMFMHGIGGAKYDQVADLILESFFGISPPAYMVVTGTLQLPINSGHSVAVDGKAVDSRLRSFVYHPETFIAQARPAEAAAAAPWAEEKRRRLAEAVPAGGAKQFCHAIRHANEKIRRALISVEEQLLQERQLAQRAARNAGLLHSREYGFCLHPSSTLRAFLTTTR